MGRRRRRNRSSQRDVFPIATTVLRTNPVRSSAPLSLDRRMWTPDPIAAVFTTPQRNEVRHDDNVNRRNEKRGVRQPRFGFVVPKSVGVCVRRKQRREVLFALRRTGKGSRNRFRRRNYFSDVRC